MPRGNPKGKPRSWRLSEDALENLAFVQKQRGNQTAVATLEQVIAEAAEAERNLSLEQRVERLETLLLEKGGQG